MMILMTSSNVSPNQNHDKSAKSQMDSCGWRKSFSSLLALSPVFNLGEWYLIYKAERARISDVKNSKVVNY